MPTNWLHFDLLTWGAFYFLCFLIHESRLAAVLTVGGCENLWSVTDIGSFPLLV